MKPSQIWPNLLKAAIFEKRQQIQKKEFTCNQNTKKTVN